jgi:hypothetical protein
MDPTNSNTNLNHRIQPCFPCQSETLKALTWEFIPVPFYFYSGKSGPADDRGKGLESLITIDSLTCSENRENPSSVEDETWKIKLFVTFKGVTNAKTNSSSKCNQHTKPKKK